MKRSAALSWFVILSAAKNPRGRTRHHVRGRGFFAALRVTGVLAVAVIALTSSLPAQPEPSADAKNALRAQVDHFRIVKERGKQAFYTQKFDLSGLPHYEPQPLP